MAPGVSSDGFGDDLTGLGRGALAGLGFEALHQVGGVAFRVAFDLFEQDIAGFVGGQAGHPLEFALLIRHQGLVLRGGLEAGLVPLLQ